MISINEDDQYFNSEEPDICDKIRHQVFNSEDEEFYDWLLDND